MIKLIPKENDDKAFTEIVSKILNNSISLTNPKDVYVVQIDHRFDYKWLIFSHKALGAIGDWRSKLRIPPFIPDRVVEELYFQMIGGEFIKKEQKPLHIYQSSEDNSYRLIRNLTNSGIFIWFSGDTKSSSQASLMFYEVLENSYNYWFVSFVNNGTWQIRGTRNISKKEIHTLIEH